MCNSCNNCNNCCNRCGCCGLFSWLFNPCGCRQNYDPYYAMQYGLPYYSPCGGYGQTAVYNQTNL